MIQALIFDLDGTLLNTISDLNNSVNETYKLMKVDKTNSEELTMSFVGHGMKDLIHKCFDDTNADYDLAYQTFLDAYDKNYAKNTKPYLGIKELIDELLKKGIKVGVNSNKNNSYTKHLIKLNFPSINLDYVLGKTDNIKTKPDPEGVNYIINKMDVKKENVIYVGDSPTDKKTADNAGLKCISVTWGFRSKEQLLLNGASILVDKPEDILKYI